MTAATAVAPAPTTAATSAVTATQVAALLDRAEFELRARSAALESILLGVLDRRLDPQVPTLQVGLRGDGLPLLEVNPDFVARFSAADVAFMLAHEAGHLLLNHVRIDRKAVTSDQAAIIANEIVVNHLVQQSMHRDDLPVARDTGEPSGVDPKFWHDRYVAAVQDTLEFDAFVVDDVVCAAELRRLFDAETTHAPPSGEAGEASATAPDAPDAVEPICGAGHRAAEGRADDQADLGKVVDRALDVAMARALDGDETVRGQLLKLGERFDTSPALARLGIERLRGRSSRTGRTGFWRQHLRRVLGTALEPGIDVRYDRKVGWWGAHELAAAGVTLPPGVGMPLLPGPVLVPSQRVVVYIDTSGSIDPDLLEQVACTVGTIPRATVVWHTFDHDIHPFTPGQPLVGGGGTSFDIIADHVADLDDRPDAVLVLTDGLARPITPPDRDRWIWLLTPDGHPWPADHGMACVTIDGLPAT